MAEETREAIEATEAEPHGEAQEAVDWEAKYKEAVAQSRKWEGRAKANADKAARWDAQEQEGMTEAEKLAKRAESAEAELAALKQKAQHEADAAEVARATGVPLALLSYCVDRDAMESFAKEYGTETKVPAAPPAPESRVLRGDGAKATTADQFAEMAENFFNR